METKLSGAAVTAFMGSGTGSSPIDAAGRGRGGASMTGVSWDGGYSENLT